MKKLACLLVAVLTIASAMAQITSATLRGEVKNQSDERLVGATIVLSHTVTGRSYAVVADDKGYYSLHGIRPDDGYMLEISFVGYKPYLRQDVVMRVGEEVVEDVVLVESTEIEAVVVTATPHQEAEVVGKFGEKNISQMPTISRSIYDVVRLMPQVTPVKGGGLSYGGVSNRYNSFMVNGVANNDMYGLSSSGTNGGLSNANPIALDAIEQLEVVVASYDVRKSGFGGGSINAITKSGTNKIEGSAYTYYNNQDFYGTTPGRDVVNRERLPKQTRQTYGVTLGGPILKDELFFFVAAEYNHSSSPSSHYLGYDGVMLDKDELNRISARYKELTGYDGGGTGRRDVGRHSASLLASIDWHINEYNRLSASYSYLDARAEEYANSLTQFTFNGSGYANYSTAHHLSLTLESRLRDRMHNTLRVGLSRVGDGRDADVAGDFPSVIIKNTGENKGVTVNIGNNRYAGVNALSQNVLTLTDDFIVELGAHSLTAGMHHEFYNIHNQYLANSYGTYTYNSVAEFEQDLASLYEYNYTDPEVTGTTQWGPRFKAAELNFYLQDRWALGRGLQLTYGVRATLPLIFNTPTANEEFNASKLAQQTGIRIGDVPRTQLLISPRIGMSWMRDYEVGRLRLDGGVGVFTGQIPFVWIVNNYSNTGVEQKGVRLMGRSEGGKIVQSAAPFTATPSATTLSNTQFMLNAMGRDFRYPQNLKASVAAEFTSCSGWQVRAEALYTKTLHNAVFKNMAISAASESLYLVEGDENTAVPLNSTVDTGYSAIYYLDNTSKGYTYSLSAAVSKSFKFGLSLSASYIFSHAYSACDVPSTSSSSNWNRTYALDLNNQPLTFSSYDIPHKFSFSALYHKRYSPLFDVSAAVIYQMMSGQRYTLCFAETVDFNGDGVFGATPMYIPTREQMRGMLFADAQSRERWDAYIEADAYLRSHRGSFVERNAMQAPMEHTIDLRVAHGFYLSRGSSRKVELSLDVMNFGNLICRHWGTSYNISGLRLQPVSVSDMQNGKPVYRFTGASLTADNMLSRWSMQLGARIVF